MSREKRVIYVSGWYGEVRIEKSGAEAPIMFFEKWIVDGREEHSEKTVSRWGTKAGILVNLRVGSHYRSTKSISKSSLPAEPLKFVHNSNDAA